MNNDIKKLQRFRRWGILTIISTIFLIWVGGWVRSTGSGMGCPDWPKCFGMWIPPTSEAALPPDYLAHYTELRLKKNVRVAKTLAALGMTELAERVKNDPSVFTHEPFNTYKTWTEYINRLIGVLVGIFIFITLILSFRLRSVDTSLFWLSLGGFIGVGFEGWLGSIVVSTNLMPSFITVHMVLAMLILIVLITAVIRAYIREKRQISPVFAEKPMLLIGGGVIVCSLVLIQIIIGTQVRENVDIVSHALGEGERMGIISNLGSVYDVHRLFYYVVAAGVLLWAWLLRRARFFTSSVRFFTVLMLVFLFSEILLGVSMHRFGLPSILQSFHLLLATLLFSSTYTVTILLYLTRKR